MNSNETKTRVILSTRQLRGFHRYLIENSPPGVEYLFPNKRSPSYWETKPSHLRIPLRIFHSRIADLLGVIWVEKPRKGLKADLVQTFNRFALTDIPYVIYLENPTALFHYELGRLESFLGSRKVKSLATNPKLKAIVCMSKACERTLDSIIPWFPREVLRTQIYPLIPSNPHVNMDRIRERCLSPRLSCLYVSSDFVIKGGPEIVEAVDIPEFRNSLEVTIITKLNSIPKAYMSRIAAAPHIKLLDFSLPPARMQAIYAANSVLLHPTFKDSFALVVLEAIKAGLCVVGTRLYAIPEMVLDNTSGFLIMPSIQYFHPDGMPNRTLWRNKEILRQRKLDDNLVSFMRSKLHLLAHDRNRLFEMSCSAWKHATSAPFSEHAIHEKWLNVYANAMKSST